MIFIIMGVAGSGKTTIGQLLSQKTDWPFFEGDSLHPQSNIQKMSAGIALSDEDRLPWLDTIHKKIKELALQNENAVFACSALKRSYRKILVGDLDCVHFVYLKNPVEIIEKRMSKRSGHFMPTSLLQSQLSTLEEPDAGEACIIRNSKEPSIVISEIIDFISKI